MWESMSLPFFSNPDPTVGIIFFIGAACSGKALGSLPCLRQAGFFSGKPVSFETGFLVFKRYSAVARLVSLPCQPVYLP